MPAIIVDATRCKKDGLCVEVCPQQNLEQQPGALPKTRYGRDTNCLRCGHCMAVCPNDALLLEGTRRDELEPLEPTRAANPEALRALMRSRRSVRLYKDELVERSVIESMLDTARWAPSGKNVQPLSYTVSSGKERMKEIAAEVIAHFRALVADRPDLALAWGASGLVKAWDAGKDVILRGAPQLIAAHGPRENPVLMGSGTIALTQIELLAAAHGLGVCWAGFVQIAAASHAPVREALGLPAGDALAGALMLGKPRVKYRAIVPRKPLSAVWR
jgi:nitroreductase/NAD-dependent dihydropyrimidine dehydrogenase PreA subunit